VVRYLLLADHPDGSKGTFFADFGFRAQQWGAFAKAPIDQGSAGDVTAVAKSGYGTRYSVDGPIKTPDGRNPRIRTVWIADSEHAAPRLITAHR